jgi:5-methylcytosine-specific restriction endonuclease McrA
MKKMNRQQMYEARLRQDGDDVTVLCNKCQKWQSSDCFHKSGHRFSSTCKNCHRDRYGTGSGYVSPSAKATKQAAAARRKDFLSEIVICVNCGAGKPRRDYYIKKEKRYSDRCCSNRRTEEQISIDIAEGMKDCTICNLRLPFSEFQAGGNGRDGIRGACRCCEASRMKFYSGTDARSELIRSTDDGTATLPLVSKMLRDAVNCSHCGVKMGQHYPVTSASKTIDHMTPLSRGGKHSLENISVMCLGCNSAKGNRTMAEFARVKKKAVRQ